jgi:hypothetical protein
MFLPQAAGMDVPPPGWVVSPSLFMALLDMVYVGHFRFWHFSFVSDTND